MQEPELSTFGALALVLGFGLALLFGYLFAGWIGALVGGVAGCTLAVVSQYNRQRRRRGVLERAPLPLDGLTPEQLIGVMSARSAAGGGSRDRAGEPPSFKSEVLTRLEAAIAGADDGPRAALARVEQLRDDFPRSAAVWAELVRRRLAVEETEAAWEALCKALALALDGGMNPMAANLIEEFPEGRDAVTLEPAHMERLMKIFEQRGDQKTADWARKFTRR